jgi:hypothetical protein
MHTHGSPKACSEADLLPKAQNDQRFLDFVARTSWQFLFFSFERVIKVVERMLTLFKLTSFSYERNGQKCNSWQKFLQKKNSVFRLNFAVNFYC